MRMRANNTGRNRKTTNQTNKQASKQTKKQTINIYEKQYTKPK